MKHKGLKQYRFPDNPMERKFADAWQLHNDRGQTLGYILSTDGWPVKASKRDIEVAATVIQWLGSPVGLSFVKDVLDDNKRSDETSRT